MAFDVYVGTMTRFYRRDWENVAQRMSREQGMSYTMIYAGGKPEEPAPAEDIRGAVKGWCKAMSGGLAPHGFGPIEWDESDERPYFTDRPGWPGYGALLTWAAHADHPDMPWPDEVPESWADDPAFEKSSRTDSKTAFRTILMPQLWLPTEFPFVFDAPTLVSDEKTPIGSTFTLRKQLEELRSRTAERLAKGSAPRAAPEPAPAAKPRGLMGRLFGQKPSPPPPPAAAEPGLAETAAYAIDMFHDLATKACEHRLPILLHF